jgi:hypothetical protein
MRAKIPNIIPASIDSTGKPGIPVPGAPTGAPPEEVAVVVAVFGTELSEVTVERI